MAAPKVFVSHSHKDDTFTERLINDLRRAGADAWGGKTDLGAGNFQQRIDEALAGCEWFILVLTRDALASPWVQQEVYAANRLKNQGRLRDLIFIQAGSMDNRELPATWGVFNVFDATRDYHLARDRTLKAVGLPPLIPSQPAPIVPSTQSPSGGNQVQQVQQVQRQTESEQAAQKKATERQTRLHNAKEEREAHRQRRLKFMRDDLHTTMAVAWTWALLPLIGAGIVAGVLFLAYFSIQTFVFVRHDTNPAYEHDNLIYSSPWALLQNPYAAFAIAGVGIFMVALAMYLINYRRVFSAPAFLVLGVVAMAVSSLVIWLVFHLYSALLVAPESLSYASFVPSTVYVDHIAAFSQFSELIPAQLLWITAPHPFYISVSSYVVQATVFGVVLGLAFGLVAWVYSARTLVTLAIVGSVEGVAFGIPLGAAVGGGWSLILGVAVGLVWTVGLGGVVLLGTRIMLKGRVSVTGVVAPIALTLYLGITVSAALLWGEASLGIPHETLWVYIPALFIGAGIGSAISMANVK